MSNTKHGWMGISDRTRNFVLGCVFTVVGTVKIWLLFAGQGNRFALFLGILFVAIGPYFLWNGWRSCSIGEGSGEAK